MVKSLICIKVRRAEHLLKMPATAGDAIKKTKRVKLKNAFEACVDTR